MYKVLVHAILSIMSILILYERGTNDGYLGATPVNLHPGHR